MLVERCGSINWSSRIGLSGLSGLIWTSKLTFFASRTRPVDVVVFFELLEFIWHFGFGAFHFLQAENWRVLFFEEFQNLWLFSDRSNAIDLERGETGGLVGKLTIGLHHSNSH